MPFVSTLYPVMEAAGCRNCHNPEGVASATRLRFPDRDVPLARVEAFGRSLVDLVDRQNPDQSLLFLKPTARIAHTGGERIPKGSTEEAILKAWVENLAKLSGPDLAAAQRYKQEEAAGHGVVPTAVLRRLTNSQYNNTVRDLLKDSTSPANGFPPEDYVNGFKNQYQALTVSPLAGRILRDRRRKAGRRCLPPRRFSRTDPLQTGVRQRRRLPRPVHPDVRPPRLPPSARSLRRSRGTRACSAPKGRFSRAPRR